MQPAVRKSALQAIDDGRARLIRIRPGEVKSGAAGIEEFEANGSKVLVEVVSQASCGDPDAD